MPTARHRRGKRRLYSWHAGRDCRRPGRSASSCAGRHARRLPGRRGAGHPRTGDERVPQRVWPDGLGDSGTAGHPAHDPRGAVPVQLPSIGCEEDRPIQPLTDGQVDRPSRPRRERDGDDLAALALPPRCPRSMPRASMLAPVASETRSPLSASSEISACSPGEPSPAATSRAPSSLRSSAVACES